MFYILYGLCNQGTRIAKYVRRTVYHANPNPIPIKITTVYMDKYHRVDPGRLVSDRMRCDACSDQLSRLGLSGRLLRPEPINMQTLTLVGRGPRAFDSHSLMQDESCHVISPCSPVE